MSRLFAITCIISGMSISLGKVLIDCVYWEDAKKNSDYPKALLYQNLDTLDYTITEIKKLKDLVIAHYEM